MIKTYKESTQKGYLHVGKVPGHRGVVSAKAGGAEVPGARHQVVEPIHCTAKASNAQTSCTLAVLLAEKSLAKADALMSMHLYHAVKGSRTLLVLRAP